MTQSMRTSDYKLVGHPTNNQGDLTAWPYSTLAHFALPYLPVPAFFFKLK